MDESFEPGGAFAERAVTRAEADLAALCRRLRASEAAVDHALSNFVAGTFTLVQRKGSQRGLAGMVMLPLLVHGAETADPDPARPIAVIHLLWWAATGHLDALADATDGRPSSPVEAKRTVLTAMGAGSHLPARVVFDIPVATAVRGSLCAELSRCWLDAIGGQLDELSVRPDLATPESVLRGYRRKTGAPYAMVAAMAARLAGATERRVSEWRRFGQTFGTLRQLVGDQHDLATGRNDELTNGTATYLLVHLLDVLPRQRREAALRLHALARRSDEARRELSGWLLDDRSMRGYAASIAPLVKEAGDLLNSVGGHGPAMEGLHGLVRETLNAFPESLKSI